MRPQAYVAFLRGINVGGNKLIKMDALAKVFGSLGFTDVKTLLASGNVLFHATQSDEALITRQIKEALRAKFGFDVGIVLRSIEEMEKIVRANPFKAIKVTPNVRLYVTFLPNKHASKLKAPLQSPDKDFCLHKISPREIFSVLTLTEKTQSTDLMNVLEKEFGREITTRNWNTVLKITNAAA